jgi:hypothetical protein
MRATLSDKRPRAPNEVTVRNHDFPNGHAKLFLRSDPRSGASDSADWRSAMFAIDFDPNADPNSAALYNRNRSE